MKFQPNQPVPLRQLRDFGNVLNAFFAFLKSNYWQMVRAIAPIPALLMGFSGLALGNFIFLVEVTQPDDFFVQVFSLLFLYAVPLIIGVYLLFTSTVVYLALLDENPQKLPSGKEVYTRTWQKLPGLLLLQFISALLIVAGFFLFIVPGIYVSIPLVLASYIYLTHSVGIGEAIKKGFSLVKGHWWSTFGLWFIANIVQSIVIQLIFLPIGFLAGLAAVILPDSDRFFSGIFSETIVMIFFGVIFFALTAIVPFQYTALGIKFFSLLEEDRFIREIAEDKE